MSRIKRGGIRTRSNFVPQHSFLHVVMQDDCKTSQLDSRQISEQIKPRYLIKATICSMVLEISSLYSLYLLCYTLHRTSVCLSYEVTINENCANPITEKVVCSHTLTNVDEFIKCVGSRFLNISPSWTRLFSGTEVVRFVKCKII